MTASPEGVVPSRWFAPTGLIGGFIEARDKASSSLSARYLSWSYLFSRVDTASLAVVRIAMGALVAFDAVRKGHTLFYPSQGIDVFSFKYQFFHWVQEVPALAPYLPYVLFISGMGVALGLFFRFFSLLSLVLVSYGFLLQPENYLNHYYMLIIVLFLLSVSPAHRSYSIDKLLFSRGDSTAPRIYLLLFKMQVEIILIYAGLVKINSDWLHLEPLRTWLLQRQDNIFFGWIWQNDFMVALGAYGIIILHVLGAPLLFFKSTRLVVFLIYCAFHITNHFVFDIGIFPWMTIVCSTVFFAADWPKLALGRILPSLRGGLTNAGISTIEPVSARNRALVVFAVLWIAFQALFPLRHVLYPGWVDWTNEGHRFAWRMKLTDRATGGVVLAAYIPERKAVHIPNLSQYMSKNQYLNVSKYPDLVQQLAWQVAELYKRKLQVSDVKVFAYLPMRINNREPALVIDPTIDLGATSSTILHDFWLMPINPNPLRRFEEVKPEELETLPTLPQLLSTIGLPQAQNCFPGSTFAGLHDAAVCFLAGLDNWNTQL